MMGKHASQYRMFKISMASFPNNQNLKNASDLFIYLSISVGMLVVTDDKAELSFVSPPENFCS